MATIHAQSWLAGINTPSTLDGCVCGWKVERSSILESGKQFEQHMADVLQGRSGVPVVNVSELFDNSDTLDDVTVPGADAARRVQADAAQVLVNDTVMSVRPLTPRETAAVDAAHALARAAEHAIAQAQAQSGQILHGGSAYKQSLLCQMLEAAFMAGSAHGAQAACERMAEWFRNPPSIDSTSAGAKP